MKKVKILIQGMHCANCTQNIEKSVNKVPGVVSCSVSLMTHKGIVEAEDSVKDAELQKAVERIGYKVVSIEH